MAFDKRAFVLAGPSGSGKSTVVGLITRPYAWVNRPQVGIFSLDACRLDFFDQILDDPVKAYAEAFKYANEREAEFNQYVTKCWHETLLNHVVIVDNTNLTRKSRARWVNDLRAKKFRITGVEVLAPLSVVLQRQRTRADKSVGDDIVRSMYMRQEGFMLGTECDELIVVDGNQDNSEIDFVGSVYAP